MIAYLSRGLGVRTVFDMCDNHFYVPPDRAEFRDRADRLRRIIDGVHENVSSLGRRRDLTVDLRRRSSHHQPRLVQIVRHERPANQGHLSLHDFSRHVGRDDPYARAGRQQLAQFPRRHGAATDENDISPGDIQE